MYIYIILYCIVLYIPLSICTFLYISRHWNSKISHWKKVRHFDLWGGVWQLQQTFGLKFVGCFLSVLSSYLSVLNDWFLKVVTFPPHHFLQHPFTTNPFEKCQVSFLQDAWNSGIWNWFVWYDCLLPLSCDLVVGCSSDHCHWHGTEHLRGHWRRSLQWPWDLETRPVPPEHGILESRHFFFGRPFEVGKK